MDNKDFKDKTKRFALEIIKLCRELPDNREGRLIGNQLFRSSTSVAANYRAACRARSRAEFISKMGIVEEEADESLFWLEIIRELHILDNVDGIMSACNEIVSIVVSSIKTAKGTNKK